MATLDWTLTDTNGQLSTIGAFGAWGDYASPQISAAFARIWCVDGARSSDPKFRGDIWTVSTSYAVGDYVSYGPLWVCTVAGTSGTSISYPSDAQLAALDAGTLNTASINQGSATFVARAAHTWGTASPPSTSALSANLTASTSYSYGGGYVSHRAGRMYVASGTSVVRTGTARGTPYTPVNSPCLSWTVSVDKTSSKLDTFQAGATFGSNEATYGYTYYHGGASEPMRGFTLGRTAAHAVPGGTDNNQGMQFAAGYYYDCNMRNSANVGAHYGNLAGHGWIVRGTVENLAANPHPLVGGRGNTAERFNLEAVTMLGVATADAHGLYRNGDSYAVDVTDIASGSYIENVSGTAGAFSSYADTVGVKLSATQVANLDAAAPTTGAFAHCSVASAGFTVDFDRIEAYPDIAFVPSRSNTVYRSGGASDGFGAYSIKGPLSTNMTLLAFLEFHNAKVDEGFYVYVDVLYVPGGLIGLTSGVVPTGEDIWLEAIYPDDPNTYRGRLVMSMPMGRDRKGLAHVGSWTGAGPAALTTSPNTWVGTPVGGLKYRLAVLVNPRRAGPILLRVCTHACPWTRGLLLSDPYNGADTVYVDPRPTTGAAP